jgi:alpha-L-fucosidase
MMTIPPRIQAYEDLGYGLFLHWGLYSQMAAGEWSMHYREISRTDYARLAESFHAEKFDARVIARFAKEAGFRYACLTTRHHDGFSLYDTRGLNDFDAPRSPAGRDLVAEFAEACRADGLAVFFYHTTLDWRDERFDADWDGYLQYLRDSVEILLTHYGKVDGLWFDGNWARPECDWQEDSLYGLIRAKQPDCVIVNNSSVKALGALGHPEVDVLTFEQGTPGALDRTGHPRYLASEMCETIRSHWGAADGDFSAKSPAALIRTLAACRGAGANLLLNIGLNADGSLPGYETETLRIVGRWIEGCGGGLYKGRPVNGIRASGENVVLANGDEFLCFVHGLPIHGNMHLGADAATGLHAIAGALPTVKRIEWTDTGESLEFSQNVVEGMLTFRVTPYPYGNQRIVRVARMVTG